MALEVSLENTSALGRRLSIRIPHSELEAKESNRLRDLTGKMRLDGFRQGKVSQKAKAKKEAALRQQYGKSIRHESIFELVEDSIKEAITKHELRPVGQPELDAPEKLTEVNAGEDIHFTATFEVYPNIDVKALSELTLERATTEITEADIDDLIKRLLNERAEFNAVERESAVNDQIVCDIRESIDGAEMAEEASEDVTLLIPEDEKESQVVPGLLAALKGRKAGDEFTVDLEFPADWAVEKYAGKPVVYEVKIKAVNERTLPELNDEFVKENFGNEADTVEALRKIAKEKLEEQAEHFITSDIRQQFMNTLVTDYPIHLPQSMVDSDIQQLRREDTQAKAQNPNLTEVQDSKYYEETARRRVLTGLVLNAYIAKHQITVSDQELTQAIMEEASQYPQPEVILNIYRKNSGLLERVRFDAMVDKLIALVKEQANFAEQSMDFKTLMQLTRDESELPEVVAETAEA